MNNVERLPDRLLVGWWEPCPYDPPFIIRGPYCEMFWTPIIGPTAMAMARTLARVLVPGEVIPVTVPDLGALVGVATPVRAEKALRRLVQFKLAKFDGRSNRLRLAPSWPMLSENLAARLPASLAGLARSSTLIAVP